RGLRPAAGDLAGRPALGAAVPGQLEAAEQEGSAVAALGAVEVAVPAGPAVGADGQVLEGPVGEPAREHAAVGHAVHVDVAQGDVRRVARGDAGAGPLAPGRAVAVAAQHLALADAAVAMLVDAALVVGDLEPLDHD